MLRQFGKAVPIALLAALLTPWVTGAQVVPPRSAATPATAGRATSAPPSAQKTTAFAAGQRQYRTLAEMSWTYRPPVPPRQIKLHELIVIVVEEKTQVVSEGEFDRRKRANSSWSLKDWILFDGWAIKPDPQSAGDPTISGEMEQRYRAEGELDVRSSMKFRMACHVVDIRPNGTFLVEGRRSIRNNNEIWELFLSGIVRPEDVQPDNTVLSENVDNLRIYKREVGHVRDSYRRGWFGRWLDQYQPF